MRRFFLLILVVVFAAGVSNAQEDRSQEKVKVYQTPEAKARKERYLSEAKEAYRYYSSTREGAKAEEALIGTCRSLILAEPYVYEDADARCGMTKRDPSCFERFVEGLNQTYGGGAFFYWPERVQVQYSASHCHEYIRTCKTCNFKDEAELRTLRGKNLLGNNLEKIFGNVEAWIAKYPNSKEMPKAYLLLARLNADAWILFKRHAFVAENMVVTEEEFSLRASKHRFHGLRTFDQLLEKFPGSPEAEVARREKSLLEREADDGVLYGISF